AQLDAGEARYELALRRYRESLAVREKLGDRAAQAQTWNGIAMCLRDKGDPRGAIDAFDRALEIRRELKDWQGEVSSLKELSKVYVLPADFDKRMEVLEQAQKVAEAVPDARSKAGVNELQGRALIAAGRNREAVVPLEASASYFGQAKDTRSEASSLGGLGLALNRVGEYARARDVLGKAIQ